MRPLRCPAPLAALALVTVLAACESPRDEPRMRDEILATAARQDARFDELRHRAEDVEQRRAALPHDSLASASADHSLSQARSVIEDERGYLRTLRTRLQKPSTRAELQQLLDEMHRRFEDAVTEAVAELSAVESWVALAAQSPAPAAQPPEPQEPPEPVDDRAPETDRSGAPIR